MFTNCLIFLQRPFYKDMKDPDVDRRTKPHIVRAVTRCYCLPLMEISVGKDRWKIYQNNENPSFNFSQRRKGHPDLDTTWATALLTDPRDALSAAKLFARYLENNLVQKLPVEFDEAPEPALQKWIEQALLYILKEEYSRMQKSQIQGPKAYP